VLGAFLQTLSAITPELTGLNDLYAGLGKLKTFYKRRLPPL